MRAPYAPQLLHDSGRVCPSASPTASRPHSRVRSASVPLCCWRRTCAPRLRFQGRARVRLARLGADLWASQQPHPMPPPESATPGAERHVLLSGPGSHLARYVETDGDVTPSRMATTT